MIFRHSFYFALCFFLFLLLQLLFIFFFLKRQKQMKFPRQFFNDELSAPTRDIYKYFLFFNEENS